jgi:pyruvate dehydrogenase E2 component (dihydrolipoamide acetyltransferase)
MAEIIEMPKLSDTMTEGTLGEWLKKEGDAVESGDVIARVETDKATMDLEVFDSGILLKIVVQEGESVPTGAPVAYVGEEGEEISDADLKASAPADKEKEKEEETSEDESADESEDSEDTKSGDSASEEKSAPAPKTSDSTPSSPAGSSGSRVKASPLARKIAEEKGVSLSGLQGSGPGGRIVKKDVLAASGSGGGSAWGVYPAAPVASDGSIKLSNMRKTIAKRLVQSKQENPHFYVEVEVDAGPMVELRSTLNQEFGESHGIKFSFNDFVMKAAANAVRDVPTVNASFEGDTIRQYGDVQLAFGVAIKDGLITPVIQQAQNKSLRVISQEANQLIGLAKEGKLTPEQYTGGTLTISNLGGPFGVDRFCAIINPPQAAILAVGNIVKKPVVNDKDEIVVGQRMTLTLSADHRVIDGAVAAFYLKAIKKFIETPALLLL